MFELLYGVYGSRELLQQLQSAGIHEVEASLGLVIPFSTRHFGSVEGDILGSNH